MNDGYNAKKCAGIIDEGESIKCNGEGLNGDGKTSRSDRKALKDDEKVLKVMTMHKRW